MSQAIINVAYVVAAVLFILGIKGLTHPRTAVRGNFLGGLGMFLAVIVTLFDRQIISFEIILAGVVVGAAIGAILATRIQMTAMPQMVGLLNGFGGIASVLVAGAALIESLGYAGGPGLQMTIATAASGLIGAVTFWGSLVAFGKLQGVITEKSVHLPGHMFLNIVLLLASIAVGVLIVLDPANPYYYWILCAVASVFGLLLVLPVGGADMPVVVALLNSYSGLAAAATGFVLNNNVLIIAGSLVGASGFILTNIMCKAMNRSLANVMVGGGTATGPAANADDIYAGKIMATSAEEVAMLFDGAQRVVIVPGYGMAVAQAQYAVRDLTTLLEARDITV
ncbi:MAG TPA: NAD(P)(+) transhydrogenase (Re/Si-specific) subunit beta, partial [Acidobacteriota bacterium]|nr:NAD(P)(+) transhydrogenase (Re/Si-specific) subunit beta [Acidobacteriota bacterium]